MVDVCVLGDGLPELAAALEFAEVGLRVQVIPASASDTVASDAASDAASADGAAHPWATAWGEHGVPDPEGQLSEFLAHIAAPIAPGDPAEERAVPRATPPAPVLLRGAKGAWVPEPEPAVWGIPAVPMSSDSLAVLGTPAAFRATLDRVRPVLTIGKTHSFGALVRSRLGATALERLVEPLVREATGRDPEVVDAALIAPGLNEALTRVGTLSGAALDTAERHVARETCVAPSAGWAALAAALRARLGLYAVEFAAEPAVRVEETEEGWTVELSGVADPSAARAIVVGVDAARAEALVPDAGSLLRVSRRAAARFAIEDPGLPDTGAPRPAVQSVDHAGERWSVRAELGAHGWEARVLSAAHADDAELRAAQRQLRAVVEAAGFVVRAGEPREWMPFAPYAEIAERDAAADRLDVWCAERPEALPAGTAVHGGSLPEAIADARARAVRIRRHLAGIAD